MTQTACRRLLAIAFLSALTVMGVKVAAPADAMPLHQVITTIQQSGGHYQRAGASLKGADCSGLVSVAQSLAMGKPIRRWGNTDSLLNGSWPHAIPGAKPDDLFVIGTNHRHMSARVGGIKIEATCCGRPFLVGAQARSPFSFPNLYHVNPEVLA